MAHPVVYHVEAIVESPMRLHSTVHEYVIARSPAEARSRAEERLKLLGRHVHEVRVVERGRFVPD